MMKKVLTLTVGMLAVQMAFAQTTGQFVFPDNVTQVTNAFGVKKINDLQIMPMIGATDNLRPRIEVWKADIATGSVANVNLEGYRLSSVYSWRSEWNIYDTIRQGQTWSIVPFDDGRFMMSLTNNPNYCLAKSGGNAILSACNISNPNQLFFLQKTTGKFTFGPAIPSLAPSKPYSGVEVDAYYIRSIGSPNSCLDVVSSNFSYAWVDFTDCRSNNEGRQKYLITHKNRTTQANTDTDKILKSMTDVFHMNHYDEKHSARVYVSALVPLPGNSIRLETNDKRNRLVTLIGPSGPTTMITNGSGASMSYTTSVASTEGTSQSIVNENYKSLSLTESIEMTTGGKTMFGVADSNWSLKLGFSATQTSGWKDAITKTINSSTTSTGAIATSIPPNGSLWVVTQGASVSGETGYEIRTTLGDIWLTDKYSLTVSGRSLASVTICVSSPTQPSNSDVCNDPVVAKTNTPIATSFLKEASIPGYVQEVKFTMSNNKCLANWGGGTFARSYACNGTWDGLKWHLVPHSSLPKRFLLRSKLGTNMCVQAPWNYVTSPGIGIATCNENNAQQHITLEESPHKGWVYMAFDDAAQFTSGVRQRSYFPKDNFNGTTDEQGSINATSRANAGVVMLVPAN